MLRARQDCAYAGWTFTGNILAGLTLSRSTALPGVPRTPETAWSPLEEVEQGLGGEHAVVCSRQGAQERQGLCSGHGGAAA